MTRGAERARTGESILQEREMRGLNPVGASKAVRGLLALASAWLCAGSCLAAPQNLYDWMGIAPIVVLGTVSVDDQRYVEVTVTEALVGTLGPGPVRIDERSANRDRELGQPSLKMEKGRTYLVLLEPGSPSTRSDRPAPYRIVRGVGGVREVPSEGALAVVSAAGRLAQVRLLRDDARQWQAFEDLLEDTNSLLVKTALDMFLKFRRGLPAHVALLRPLLDHPEPEVRAETAQLIAQIAGSHANVAGSDDQGLVAEVIARARRDPAVGVRVAATACLGSLGGASAEPVLREIAREDPEQDVRYAAERALYERGARPAPGAIDAGSDGPL